MYVPTHFSEDRIEVLHDLIRKAGLATLVSMTTQGTANGAANRLIASHAPLLLDPDPAPYGTLIGHLAKANPHAQAADPGVQTLVIFQGSEGYITPSYYAAKQEHGKVVPTWNYAAIHAYGTLQMFDDPARLLAVVTRLTRRHETPRAQPWAVSDAPADFVRGMLNGIVGIALPIDRLEGKVKMSQNRPATDIAGVVDGLRQDGRDDLATAVLRATAE
ncbi:MAG TPA: FMN-binding negative transcriptional regulator [Rhodopila sp.]